MLVEERDYVGPVLRTAEAGKGHLGAGCKRLRAGQPLGEIVPVPGAALLGQRVREGKAMADTDRLTQNAPEIGSELVGATLVGIVAGSTFLESLGAFGRIGAGEVEFDGCSAAAAPSPPSCSTPAIGYPIFSGRSLWNSSPATIDDPRATMPANSTQPAMVLKRSSMDFPVCFPDPGELNLGRLLRASSDYIKQTASARAGFARWRPWAAPGTVRPAHRPARRRPPAGGTSGHPRVRSCR